MTPENLRKAFLFQREKFAAVHMETVAALASKNYEGLFSEPCTPATALTFAEAFSLCPTTASEVAHIQLHPAGARAFLLFADRAGDGIENNSDALAARIVEKPTEFYVLSSFVLDYLCDAKAQNKILWE